jgi:hypothetical protein
MKLKSFRGALWICGLAMATFAIGIIVADRFSAHPTFNAHRVGHDFLAFYTGGTFLREGHLEDVYDLPKLIAFQRDLTAREKLPIGERFAPFWNPPIFIWIFVPLSTLPYFQAWWIWFAINMVCLTGAMVILCRMLIASRTHPRVDWTTWGLVPLLIPLSSVALLSIGHGQNTCISILLLSAIVVCWRSDRALLAGLICGLLFYKPQLALIIAVVLVATLGWRALVGLAITGVILLAISEITLPGSTRLWLTRLPEIVKYMQVEHVYAWDRHVTLKSFWRLLIQGYPAGDLRPIARIAWIASEVALLLALARMVWRVTRGQASRDLLIAATIVAMPLLMPFYFDYDLMLLSVAAVVYASHRLREPREISRDRATTALWVCLYLWLFLNAYVATRTHVNLAVILMAVLCVLLILAGNVRFEPNSAAASA